MHNIVTNNGLIAPPLFAQSSGTEEYDIDAGCVYCGNSIDNCTCDEPDACACSCCYQSYECSDGSCYCGCNGGEDEQPEELFVNTVSDLVGMPYVYGSDGPTSFDCSSTICYGLRQINSGFGDYSANQLYNMYTEPSTNPGRGTLVFYDYTSNGSIDHVTTLLGDGNMIHPSSGSGSILNVPSSYLDNYTNSRGGTIYYQEINWNSINP